MALKKGNEIPTIDVVLVTVSVDAGAEIALETSNKVAIDPALESEDAVKLIVKGKLLAQKPTVTAVTGMAITLTDNVFNPELVKILQGGTIKYWTTAEHTTSGDTDAGFGVASYTPPTVGSGTKGSIFTLNTYSAIYDTSAQITGYEKISYPNCQGQPVGLSSEDGSFRAPEYTINSAPENDEAPYTLDYVSVLPTVS